MAYQIYIYTLALQDGFYYVGKSLHIERRLNKHFGKKGAVWTKLHPPIEIIEQESFLVSSLEEENARENHQTIKMMKLKGWQNVRGGFWCTTNELETLKNLHHHGYFLDIDIESAHQNIQEQYVFLLELEDNKYFVGYTRSLQNALKKHEKGAASVWTHTYKPLQLLKYKKIVPENNDAIIDWANEWVLEYGVKYGYENIRGGMFTNIDTNHHLKSIQSYLKKKGIESFHEQKRS